MAAVEDPNRRIDEELAVVVRRRQESCPPIPPSSSLSLLAYSCLGTAFYPPYPESIGETGVVG